MVLRRLAGGLLAASWALALMAAAPAGATEGYYRYPTLAGDTVVFTAEGDLWSVPVAGGKATRLTTHAGEEWSAAAAPDGKRVAFAASYDGPVEVYVMPLSGGLPKRLTFEGARAVPVGWTPAGEVLYIAQNPTGPSPQFIVAAVDPETLHRHAIPLADVSDAAAAPDGKTLFFTRFGFAYSGDNVEAYRGGLAARLWRYDLGGSAEATPLGNSDDKDRVNDRRPMPCGGRLYFISDRDGHDNLWSMTPDGGDPRELTHETEFGVRGASLGGGRIVYQLGADLHVFDVAAGSDRKLDIDLTSDLDQERRHVIKKPLDFFDFADFAPNGERVAVTARGRVALMGVGPLRRVDIATPPDQRVRAAVESPDGKWVYATVEPAGSATGTDPAAPQIWRFPADGSNDGKPLTSGDAGYRWGLWLSPDGKLLANAALDGRLYLLDLDKGENAVIDTAPGADLEGVAWSPDSKYLAIVRPDSRVGRGQLFLYEPATQAKVRLTSDRYQTYAPAFTPDGKWLYFLSDRQFESSNTSPWGDRNLGPYFDRRTRIYALALQSGLRFPFQPKDELAPADKAKDDHPADGKAAGDQDGGDRKPKPAADKDKPKPVDWAGLAERLYEVPVSPGNYRQLQTDGKLLYYLDMSGHEGRGTLKTLKIDNRGDDPDDFLGNVREFKLSADRKKMFIRRWAADNRVGDMYIVPAGAKAPERLGNAPTELGREKDKLGRTSGDFGKLLDQVDKFLVRASDWTIEIDPKAEWRQIFGDAWRLHRDFFYDRTMRGTDWLTLREKYRPLVDRVADRGELDDVLAQMMGELRTLHSRIRPGDMRIADDTAKPAFLGAVLTPEAGGARITHIYRSDPELPDRRGPLAITAVDAREGDLITAVNGQPVSAVHDIAELLVGRAGQQVLLTLKRRDGGAPEREIKTVVWPVDATKNYDLRYGDWEEGRRAKVEAASGGRIGYLHLRAMGSGDIATFAREFYAQYDREGLIIDVRRNNGGNVDSWVIEKLLRRAWAVWRPRYGEYHWHNMQQSFRGHLAVLIDERTYSDGETFSAGIKALGIAPLIGARTAGAGIWLNGDTGLSDRGEAGTAEFPQYSVATGEFLVENKGVEPDIPVDNPPHATFTGEDAQLDTAIRVLLEKLKAEPVPPP